MTKIAHHPDHATLMSFAAGALPESLAAVVATHNAMCPSCRAEVRRMERVGAALMSAMEKQSVAPVPQAALSMPQADAARDAEPVSDDPIERLVGSSLEDVKWKRLGLGVWHYPIETKSPDGGDLRLIKVQKGQAMPEHGHGGSELTLVLDGSYTDEIGTFGAGDVADLDDTIEHRPIADSDTGCICLIASERKARFTGVIGRLLQPFTGI
ncbi:MAG: ChrR family anti-sigma-E factor [Pseudomonadota bacterium]